MSVPSAASLKNRARVLLEAMSDRERWVYAVPPEAEADVRSAAAEAGLRPAEGGGFEGEGGASLRFFVDPEIGTAFVIAEKAGVVPALGKVIDKVGFFAQSQLLAVAYDADDEETASALRTLAYMIVSWGEPWPELFDLHLTSPSPELRALAGQSLALVGATTGAAAIRARLEAALQAEETPATQEALRESIARLPAQ